MRKRMAAVAFTALALLVPTAAVARTDTERTYLKLYNRVADKQGKRAPGRNIVKWGLRDGRSPTHHRLKASITILRRMLTPAPAASSQTLTSAPATAAQVSTPVRSSGGGLPGCASESGTNYSTGPDNTNPSGATGRYQIIPSTHAAHCSDLGWSPREQDECAARIYAAQGAGAWVNC